MNATDGALIASNGLHHGSRTPAESRTYYDEPSRTGARPARPRPGAYSDLTLRDVAADHLYVSLNTVSAHAWRLYRRLGVRTRAETVAATRERGTL
jgi:hypothetical protein